MRPSWALMTSILSPYAEFVKLMHLEPVNFWKTRGILFL
jgi:hypothetical protein